ncbi:helix-turn-helix transcriptional regulator [Pedobacter sp. ISL-68]|uniref:helix-turn-helix transcriptional regulator n=1 Tax=unclassified Pedobacter TaxID=2628915 RepID=UPI001BEACED7|nr:MULTISPECIES: helix-turn-helix transcriptional regulator [unclassified Pedobacter]MBT2561081.1 helix-turn-helix transcriptional regulator [Pedobacter sp. ISL-64]MBT2590470.1 helix-turn-helix transcriptional regulator [Pedobacter sp. ISL-68]
MEFKQFLPSDPLKPYIRHYYIFKSDADSAFEDVVFPSGDMEVIFNLGNGSWESLVNNGFKKTPKVELWGQITKPLAIRSVGKHVMLGIKFYTHSASYFFNDQMGVFNDSITDLRDVIGGSADVLHQKLLETDGEQNRIDLLEAFLLKRLISHEKKSFHINKVADILNSILKDASGSNITYIASRHNITTRYLQRLLHQHTGLSPKSYDKINRFQQSLKMISKNEEPFTNIAYACGYFDQSHFIRDFKSFTGLTPSSYLDNLTPVNQLLFP